MNLKDLRKAAGKTQIELAKETEVHERSVREWEKGAIPSLDNAIRIANALNCSLNEIAEAFGLEAPRKTDDLEECN